MTEISRDFLESLFVYDKSKGEIFWKNDHTGKIKAGRKAGCKVHSGFVVRVNGKLLRQSKIVWCLETGEFPKRMLKTKDGNVHNTRFDNLYMGNPSAKRAVATEATCGIIRDNFTYDPETGAMNFLDTSRKSKIKETSEGYLSCHFLGRSYFVHRLIWCYMTGAFPKSMIDHIDGNRSNNQWANLREANNHQNGCNRLINKGNKIGYKNVFLDKATGLYKSHIMTHGKQKHLGYFKTAEDAHKKYADASKVLHGEFSNPGKVPERILLGSYD